MIKPRMSWWLKRLAQVGGGAFFPPWLGSELGGMAGSILQPVFCDLSETVWSEGVKKACVGVLSGL